MTPKRKMSVIDIQRAFETSTDNWLYVQIEGGTIYKFNRAAAVLETGITTEGELIVITDPEEQFSVQLLVDDIVSLYSTNNSSFATSSSTVILNPSPLLLRNYEYPLDTKYFSYNLFDVLSQQDGSVSEIVRVSGYCHVDLSEGNKTLSLKFNREVNGSDKETFPKFTPTSDAHILTAFNFEQNHRDAPVERGLYKRYNTLTFHDYNVKAVRWEYNYIRTGFPYVYYLRMDSLVTPKSWASNKIRVHYRLKNMMMNQFFSEDFFVKDQTAGIIMTRDLKLGTIYLEPDTLPPVMGFKQVAFHDIDMIDLEDLIVTMIYEPV